MSPAMVVVERARSASATPRRRGGRDAPRGPCTLARARRGAIAACSGSAMFPMICGRYAPAAWPQLRACYPLRGPGDEERAVEVLIEGIAQSGAFPVMDARQRQWRQMEIDDWRDVEGEEDEDGGDAHGGDEGDGGNERPFWAVHIPLTNDDTLYWCATDEAPLVELLLADLIADDECKEYGIAKELRRRLAAPGMSPREAGRVLAIHGAGRALPTDALDRVLCRDTAGIFGRLPGALPGVPGLCAYMQGQYDNPFLCPNREIWYATELDAFPWSWENVEIAASWWDTAQPVVDGARAVRRELARPATVPLALATLAAAIAHGYTLAGMTPPAALLACYNAWGPSYG